MRFFADSSAIVKIYVNEEGSDRVRSLDAMYVCEIARVEIAAAFWRKVRVGEIERQTCLRVIERFEDDFDLEFGPLVPVTLDVDMLKDAAHLAGVHGLRAYDAVQLSSAAKVRSIDPECQTFVTFDQELLTAAEREEFIPLPD